MRIIDLCKGDIEGTIDVNEGGVNLLIIRREIDISLVPLTVGEFTFLTALHNHTNLSEALFAATKVDRHFNFNDKLPDWITNKTLVNCST